MLICASKVKNGYLTYRMATFTLLALSTWMIIGGMIAIVRNRTNYFPITIRKAVILDWKKQKSESGFLEYHPIIQFKNKRNEAKIETLIGGYGSVFNSRWFTYRTANIIWISINKEEKVSSLIDVLFELMLFISFIALGSILLLELIPFYYR